jgi:hypothetical protein
VDDQPLFDELLHAAARLGVAVRIEPFATPATMGGGLYVVRGESLILIDQRAPLPDRLRAVARAHRSVGSRQLRKLEPGAGVEAATY